MHNNILPNCLWIFREVETDIKIVDIENQNNHGQVTENVDQIEVVAEENENNHDINPNMCVVPEFVKPTKEFIDKAKLGLKVLQKHLIQ